MEVKKIFQELANLFVSEIETITKTRDEAQENANSHGGAMESRYDTFKEEAQYLVSGYQKKILLLQADLSNLRIFISNLDKIKKTEEIKLGNLVITKTNTKETTHYLYSPVGGGKKVTFDNLSVLIVTPTSPFGKALLGKKKGDELNINLNQKIETIL